MFQGVLGIRRGVQGVPGILGGPVLCPPLQVRSRESCWLLRGPLVPDGYGVGVAHGDPPDPRAPPGGGELRVAVAAFACCHETDPAVLGGHLRDVLDRLGGLLRCHTPPEPAA